MVQQGVEINFYIKWTIYTICLKGKIEHGEKRCSLKPIRTVADETTFFYIFIHIYINANWLLQNKT